jgi:ribosomal protein L9
LNQAKVNVANLESKAQAANNAWSGKAESLIPRQKRAESLKATIDETAKQLSKLKARILQISSQSTDYEKKKQECKPQLSSHLAMVASTFGISANISELARIAAELGVSINHLDEDMAAVHKFGLNRVEGPCKDFYDQFSRVDRIQLGNELDRLKDIQGKDQRLQNFRLDQYADIMRQLDSDEKRF